MLAGPLLLARTIRTWIKDQGDIREAGTSRSAYPWLNTLMLRVLREEKGLGRLDYLWGSFHGAHLAKSLGVEAVSLIEFGVAGGNGLIALERVGRAVERHLGVRTSVYGFDTGIGLPPPKDVRDCPNLFASGDYSMDVEKLRTRLSKAELILGLVAETLPAFVQSRPDPLAFISFDLDLYSSTAEALRLLEADVELLLPRVHCYFDDTTGFTYGDFNGERLAISEFNETHAERNISPFYGLDHYVPRRAAGALWVKKFFLAHIFDHPLYGAPDGLVRVALADLTESES